MKRVALIANDFPPIGGAGVQRAVYLAKYLPELGWMPTVFTVRDVVFPAKDPTLLDELPSTVEIVRTESAELRRLFHHLRSIGPTEKSEVEVRHSVSSLLRELGRKARAWLFGFPDDRVLWLPFVLPAIIRAHRDRPFDLILATTPPYGSGVVGALSSRWLSIPLVVDLRDPWFSDPYTSYPTAFHRWANDRIERMSLERASAIIVVAPSFERSLKARYGDELGGRLITIPNGFDENLFAGSTNAAPGIFRYVGSLYAHHVDVFERFLDAFRDVAYESNARLEIAGRCDPEIERLIARKSMESLVTILGYRSHGEAIELMRSAAGLLVMIKSLGSEAVVSVPGKLFEAMAARRPLLFIGPEGDARDLAERAGATAIGSEAKKEDISLWIRSVLDGGAAACRIPDGYTRHEVARAVADTLDSVVNA